MLRRYAGLLLVLSLLAGETVFARTFEETIDAMLVLIPNTLANEDFRAELEGLRGEAEDAADPANGVQDLEGIIDHLAENLSVVVNQYIGYPHAKWEKDVHNLLVDDAMDEDSDEEMQD